jgi:hypothetical protein
MMDVQTLKTLVTNEQPTETRPATVDKNGYVLSFTDPSIARILTESCALETAVRVAKKKLDENLKLVRDYGVSRRDACARLLGGAHLTVKIPYADENGSPRLASVTCSRRYTVKPDVLKARGDMGDAFDQLFEVAERHVLTPKGLDVVRGLLARSGLTGKQIEAAIEQMCEVETTVSAVEDFDERAAAMASMEAALARSFVTRAAASVKL